MSKMSITKNISIITAFFMCFLAIQPLLDLLTSFSILILDLSITPGIIIRFFVMLVGFIYILLYSIKHKDFKIIIYFIVLALFFILNLVVSKNLKPIFDLKQEVISIGKLIYFIQMFYVFTLIFRNKSISKQDKLSNKFTKYPSNIVVSQLMIVIVMVISDLTNTTIRSYGALYKIGHSGWFFSANELSSILAICYPILIWTFVKNDKIKEKISILAVVVGSTFAQFTIGTKVGYLAVIITLIICIITFFLELIISIIGNYNKPKVINLTIISLLLGLIVIFTPYIPAVKNTDSHIGYVTLDKNELIADSDSLDQGQNNTIDNEDILEPRNNQETVKTIVYSGRDGFLNRHKLDYMKSNSLQKIFGMGYAGNYTENAKIIERDFHDIFYQYGWLGTVLISLPFLYYGIIFLILAFQNFYSVINYKIILSVTSILLGCGIAYIAGHVLISPAVSTYLAIVSAYLTIDINQMKNKKLEN